MHNMTLPEKHTPEWVDFEHRVHRRIMDMVSNIAFKQQLPPQIHVLIFDDITNEMFGSFVGVKYLGESGMVHKTRTSIGMLAPDSTPKDIAEMLIEEHPGTPLLLDEKVAEKLSDDSVTLFEDDHCSLQGVSGGTIEVFVPFKSSSIPKDSLPPGFVSGQLFEE